jgi:hypothetical protein
MMPSTFSASAPSVTGVSVEASSRAERLAVARLTPNSAATSAQLLPSEKCAFAIARSRSTRCARVSLPPLGRVKVCAGWLMFLPRQWFNRRGGQPTVTHTPDSGVYNVTFPGSTFNIDTNVVPLATLVSSAGEIGVDTSGER